MQSGRKGTGHWHLEFQPNTASTLEPLMGWTSSDDTKRQLGLYFDTCDEAVAYAKANHLTYEVITPKQRRLKPKAYADNFRHDLLLRWTH